MNAKEDIQNLIKAGLKENFDLEPDEVHLERPADESHGDWATNVAMSLAKELGKSPRDIATELVGWLEKNKPEDLISSIELAGPGFINFRLTVKYFISQLDAAIQEGSNFGRSDIGEGKQIMIEYGQPNTHKAFHVGHLKSAISGLALVKLYENLGYKVVQANFYGDVGMHVAKCTWGAIKKGLPEDIESMDPHERMKMIDAFYSYGSMQFKDDPKAEQEIREINQAIYAGSSSENVETYKKLRDWSLEHLNLAFKELGVNYSRQYPESEFTEEAINIVKRNIGNIFQESEGAIIYDGSKEGLTTWVFLTKEGLPTYEGKDLALAYKKFEEYDLDFSLITTSVEQSDRFKVIIKALEKIDPARFEHKYKHIPFGWLLRNNKKTSSRMGDSVKGMDVIAEAIQEAKTRVDEQKGYSGSEKEEISRKVGLAGLRFLILSHEFHKNINYDPEEFTSFDGFSGPYLLYSLARANSIVRDAGEVAMEAGENILKEEKERRILKYLDIFEEIAIAAAQNNAPHLLCNYLYELAQRFNQFYTEQPILKEGVEEKDKNARVLLTKATAQVLENGLGLLGIETVERM